MIEPHYASTPAHEPGRTVHSINPEGYETIEYRKPKKGEFFADCKGEAAWIYLATSDHHEPQRIVRPSDGALP